MNPKQAATKMAGIQRVLVAKQHSSYICETHEKNIIKKSNEYASQLKSYSISFWSQMCKFTKLILFNCLPVAVSRTVSGREWQ